MLSPYARKKYIGFIILMFLPALTLFLVTYAVNFMIAAICFLVVGGLAIVITNLLLRNPFTHMLEGKGLLACTLDSTGILRFFNLYYKSPYIQGEFEGNKIEDVFDREATFHLVPPEKKRQGEFFHNPNGDVLIKLDNSEYNKSKMNLNNFTVLFYDAVNQTMLTKDYLSSAEKESFINHVILSTSKKIEELLYKIRDFSRHVVDQIQPQQGFWTRGKKITAGVIGVLIFVILLIFLLVKSGGGGMVGNIANTASDSLNNAAQKGAP